MSWSCPRLTRRQTLTGTDLALTAALATIAPAAAIRAGGIAGGGALGRVQFSLVATRMMCPGEAGSVLGAVHWVDPTWHGTGLTLVSTAITAYGPLADVPTGRELRGQVLVNGREERPFVLRAVDAGPPGSGQDTVPLIVGAAEGTPSATPETVF